VEPPDYPNDPGPPEERFPSFDSSRQSLPLRRAQGSAGRGGGANPWLVGLAIAVVLGAVSVIAFGLFGPADGQQAGTTSTSAADTTDPTDPTDTTDTTDPTDPTDPTGGGDTTATTEGTSVPGSTITIPSGEAGPIEPVGEAIPIDELTMSSDDLGPLEFGDPGSEVLGRLVATFGDPSDDTGFIIGNGSWGECPGDTIRIVQWGPLNIVTRGTAEDHTFASYRLDLRYGGINSPTTDIRTLSGLQVGDTVGDLETIYAGFVVEYTAHPSAGIVFELRSERAGELLLWGPVESPDDAALVTGIYSPDSCEEDA
jgi:hypothetical protein